MLFVPQLTIRREKQSFSCILIYVYFTQINRKLNGSEPDAISIKNRKLFQKKNIFSHIDASQNFGM